MPVYFRGLVIDCKGKSCYIYIFHVIVAYKLHGIESIFSYYEWFKVSVILTLVKGVLNTVNTGFLIGGSKRYFG